MTDRPWVANKPEQRFSIAFNRLLKDTLLQPCWFTAIHDADGGTRTNIQRARDANRGIRSGQLDWDVMQRDIYRKVELKRGKNDTTDMQDQTIKVMTACGFPPIVAWTLGQAVEGMAYAGFRFSDNLPTKLQFYTEQLAAWDREAEAIKSGAVVKKRSTPRPAGPRNVAPKSWRARAGGKGVRV